MRSMYGKDKTAYFTEALRGKNVPVLTLDNKWYRLLDEDARKAVKETEDKLNDYLKRQGKLNTESKEIKRLKKKLMSEIVQMVDDAGDYPTAAQTKELDQHKKLVEECNEKLEAYQDELLELPRQIDEQNLQLMLLTMENCYDTMQENSEQIHEIADWVTQIRVELKKKLVHKQELEQQNYTIYSYMHDLLGADIIDLFDLAYNPEEQHPTVSREPEKTPENETPETRKPDTGKTE